MNAAMTTSLAERLADLGGIPVERVRTSPPPGTATLEDLIRVNDQKSGRCELVDNTLVEKAMGWRESLLAGILLRWLGNYVDAKNLGVVTGADGMTRLVPGVVRGPDVAFVSWDSLPDGKLPQDAIPDLAPDFVIEVLSLSNTRAEMARKRREYFQGGVRLMWMVDPQCRTIAVFQTAENVVVVDEDSTITGGDVLPGWSFDTAKLFAELDRKAPPTV